MMDFYKSVPIIIEKFLNSPEESSEDEHPSFQNSFDPFMETEVADEIPTPNLALDSVLPEGEIYSSNQ